MCGEQCYLTSIFCNKHVMFQSYNELCGVKYLGS